MVASYSLVPVENQSEGEKYDTTHVPLVGDRKSFFFFFSFFTPFRMLELSNMRYPYSKLILISPFISASEAGESIHATLDETSRRAEDGPPRELMGKSSAGRLLLMTKKAK
jgi:hypothetical protein